MASKFGRLWPPSLHDLGLQVHLQIRSITASKYIIKEQWWLNPDTAVTEVEWVTRRIYSGDPGVDRQHIIFISSCQTTKIHTLSFPTFGLRSMRLCGSSRPGSIISSQLLPTLLELNVEGTQGETFAASPIALQSRYKRVPSEPIPTYGHS